MTDPPRVRFDDPLRAACPATCPHLPSAADVALRHRFVEANGLRFHLVEAGDGPLVLLLHGFPEFWYGWRKQIPALAARFRVVAPDLHGYNLTDKPPSGYDIRTLSGDVPALIHALGERRAHVVGHDWGGMLAWGAAGFHAEAVDRLAVLNAPHPAAFLREVTHNPRQWLKSWYIGLFQVPGLADALLKVGHARLLGAALRGSARDPAVFSDTDLAAYRRALLRPGAVQAALAYYRAMTTTSPWELVRQLPPITAPTLLIWGLRDTALVPDLTEGVDAWAPNLRVERIADATHWVQHERPDEVNRLLLEHLTG
jgi:pimeloyl-ACP methyl ester carboxylesterase